MRNFIFGGLATLLVLISGALITSFSGLAPVAAVTEEPAVIKWFLHNTFERSVARRAESVTVPDDLNNPQRIQRGASNFASMCAGCHTAPGASPTAVSQGLNPAAPAADKLTHLSPAERFWVIRNGVMMTGMPAFGPSHDDSELWALVAFTEQLADLDAEGYQRLVQAGRAQQPAGDGHAHSHMNDAGHEAGDAGHDSETDTAASGASDHHGAAASGADTGADYHAESADTPDHHAPEPEKAPPADADDHSGHSHAH